jgi:demethylmenaquinone methyltransferase/2-methoxy-6-polyprenyl-1,4-benzoquinol methylase
VAERDPRAVREMFDRIAPRYDLLNTVLSAGADAGWRRAAAADTLLRPGGSALDVACGSGKLTRQLLRLAGPTGRVIGLDFSERMLRVAAGCGGHRIRWERGDALALPFADRSFDTVTIAFGLRNLSDPERGLSEMWRVLRPGGRAVILEFVRPPRTPAGSAYRLYLRTLLPWLGGLVSGSPEAYRYLSDTVDSYRTPDELRGLAESAGWRHVRYRGLTLGTVGLVSGGGQ